MIGLQYLFASMFFGAISGLLAMGVRWQLGLPGPSGSRDWSFAALRNIVGADGAVLPGGYNMLVTMHATIMVFFVIMPLLIGVFGNFLIPLKIGAPDMAFPFFNELSFWLFMLSGFILLSQFLRADRRGAERLDELCAAEQHARVPADGDAVRPSGGWPSSSTGSRRSRARSITSRPS